jgi:hypothetical protein
MNLIPSVVIAGFDRALYRGRRVVGVGVVVYPYLYLIDT